MDGQSPKVEYPQGPPLMQFTCFPFTGKYGLKPADYQIAYAADKCSISLPLFNGMTEAEQEYIIESVLNLKC